MVMIMRLVDNSPYKKIAETLGITENSAKVSYHHAVTLLKEKLGK